MLLPPTHLPRDVQHRTGNTRVTQRHVFGPYVQFTYIAHCHLTNVEIGLDINADKNKYMVMSRDQNAGRSHNVIVVPLKGSGTIQMFGNIINKSEFCSEIN